MFDLDAGRRDGGDQQDSVGEPKVVQDSLIGSEGGLYSGE